MEGRRGFANALAKLSLSPVERALALLWYYRQTQAFEERTASELANDLRDEGFPRPNVTRLRNDLTKSRFTVKGRRVGSFQLDVRRLPGMNEKYSHLLKVRQVEVTDKIVPSEWVSGTRVYLEKMVHQINGAYEYGFYDACAVLCRRLMESLIIDTYISTGRVQAIQTSGVFIGLEKLISTIRADLNITLNRNTPKTMVEIKQLGDTAAHDRVYITQKQDIDDVKTKYRRMIRELLDSAGIKK